VCSRQAFSVDNWCVCSRHALSVDNWFLYFNFLFLIFIKSFGPEGFETFLRPKYVHGNDKGEGRKYG
jgi:hypothetical protein